MLVFGSSLVEYENAVNNRVSSWNELARSEMCQVKGVILSLAEY